MHWDIKKVLRSMDKLINCRQSGIESFESKASSSALQFLLLSAYTCLTPSCLLLIFCLLLLAFCSLFVCHLLVVCLLCAAFLLAVFLLSACCLLIFSFLLDVCFFLFAFPLLYVGLLHASLLSSSVACFLFRQAKDMEDTDVDILMRKVRVVNTEIRYIITGVLT